MNSNCIDLKIISAFLDSNYDYIQNNLTNISSQIENSSAVDLLADIAILRRDRKLMSYLKFHPRYLINKHKNSHDNLEFLLDFMKTDLGDNFVGFPCYNYYLEDLTNRRTLDLYAKYGMDLSDCDVQVIDNPEFQELAIQYGILDTRVTLDRFIKYLEICQKSGQYSQNDSQSLMAVNRPDNSNELSEEIINEIENDFENYYDQFEAELPENEKLFCQNLL